MTQEHKKQVKEALLRYLGTFPSQDAAIHHLGINALLIDQLKNDNCSVISDETWYSLARQVGFYCGEWHAADTAAFMLLKILFGDARHYAMVYGIAFEDGLGKTFTAKYYIHNNPGTCYISCSEDMNRKTFLAELLRCFTDVPAAALPIMMQRLFDNVCKSGEPLFIIDDAHKLKDRVFHLLLSITALLRDKCGFVIMGNNGLRKRIADGLQQQKEEYLTFYKAIGRRFITQSRLSPNDIEIICRTNGLNDEKSISNVKRQCKGKLYGIESIIRELKHEQTARPIAA